jgi:ABC-type Mn2+/Zn2+ transport system permease subunit
VTATVWHSLSEPWTVAPVLRAFGQVGLLAVVGGTLGCWVVFGNLAYSAESLSHAMFPGLVVAALVGASLLLGGAIGIALAAVAVAAVSQAPAIGRDTAVAVVITTLFGLGALLALSPATPPGIEALLFGNLLGLSSGDLVGTVILAAGVLVALRVLHERLLVLGFDRTGARSLGVRPAIADAALLILLAASVLVSVQAVGTLLTPAVLVGPAAAARFLARRMPGMMVAATALALAGGVGGIYLSFYAGTAAGASFASMLVAEYAVVRVGFGRRRARAVGI